MALVEGCKEAGAKVLIFSDQHVSGQQLKQLSGVAAILRFPLPLDLDEEEDEEEVEEDDDDDGGDDGDGEQHADEQLARATAGVELS